MKCRPQHGLSSSCFRWHVFRHRSRTSKARGSTPRCGHRLSGHVYEIIVRTNDCEGWHARLNRKAVSVQLPRYKLTDLLYREARITDVTMKMFCPTRISKDSRANPVHMCSTNCRFYGRVLRRNTVRGRPSAGVFPRVFVSVTVVCVTIDRVGLCTMQRPALLCGPPS